MSISFSLPGSEQPLRRCTESPEDILKNRMKQKRTKEERVEYIILDPFSWIAVLLVYLLVIQLITKEGALEVTGGWSIAYLSLYVTARATRSIFFSKKTGLPRLLFVIKPLILFTLLTYLILVAGWNPQGLLLGVSSLFTATIFAAGKNRKLLAGVENART